MKKGSKSTLGYKGFARTDEEGFIDKLHTTPANRAESSEFGHMIEGASAQPVLAELSIVAPLVQAYSISTFCWITL